MVGRRGGAGGDTRRPADAVVSAASRWPCPIDVPVKARCAESYRPWRVAGQRDRYIPLRSAVAAVESAAAVLGVEDFGRQLAMRQSIDILGPVGVAARTATTVAEAFTILDTYMSAYSPGITARIHPHSDETLCRFEFDFLLHPRPPQAQAIELALGVTLRALHLFLGTTYRAVSVHLPHAALGTKTNYRRYFGCPPHFDEPFAGFTLRAADLLRPLNHDPLAHQLALRYLFSTHTEHATGFTDTVRSIIRQLLPTGELTAELVARQFGIHPKTLQRRLSAEGTTIGKMIDQTPPRTRQQTAARHRSAPRAAVSPTRLRRAERADPSMQTLVRHDTHRLSQATSG